MVHNDFITNNSDYVDQEVKDFLHSLYYRECTPYVYSAKDVCSDTTTWIGLHHYIFKRVYKEVPNRITLHNKYKVRELIDYLFDTHSLAYKNGSLHRFEGIFFDPKEKYAISISTLASEVANDACEISLFSLRSCNVKEVIDNLDKFKVTNPKKDTIGIFLKEYGEVVVRDYKLDYGKYIFNTNLYNEDFAEASHQIISKLNNKQAGLYLLYGDPGTGKSSFIRHLASEVKRRFVYVPPHMVDAVFSVDLLGMFMEELKGSVLVVEDAEKVLLQRDASDGFHNSATVSSILNTTDGIYSDIANLSIVCTYNCDRNSIDKAFLRKGRLKFEYKFGPLTVDRARKLAQDHNINKTITEPITLAELLNPEQTNIEGEEIHVERRVGFCS